MKIKFYRKNEAFGDFSNFSEHPIKHMGTLWPTVEHYFQASKFISTDDQLAVLSAHNAFEAAKIGRQSTRKIRTNWDSLRCGIMKEALKAKFTQHNDIRELLLSTGDAELIEHTDNDHFWADGGDGTGQNMLGKLLMEVRKELSDEPQKYMQPPWLYFPNAKCFAPDWRMGEHESYLDEWILWCENQNQCFLKEYFTNNKPPVDWLNVTRRFFVD
ncbi:NADAR family protein [Algibacillus agarilyticus]|uniref:NADAR family protein n=1 Tax=Algibacillus agarilyticus TaxID=2234133 RepID=UPI000DD02EC1|nr:NADAR domain-containing protein [Algibacillus agarilyticus]